jgi:hypothetical protein
MTGAYHLSVRQDQPEILFEVAGKTPALLSPSTGDRRRLGRFAASRSGGIAAGSPTGSA